MMMSLCYWALHARASLSLLLADLVDLLPSTRIRPAVRRDPGPVVRQSRKQAPAMAAAALMEELLEEVLLRIPPDDPASLARAALVSKRWCRLICGGGFRRRFREFHGNKPPLLGFLCQCHETDLSAQAEQDPFLVPTSSFKPPRPQRHRGNLIATHSCHGRVLLYSASTWAPWACADVLEDLFVWDPITDKLRKLPRWPLRLKVWYSDPDRNWNAAVLCAAALRGNGGCDHLDCHFMVVLVGIADNAETFISVYSSEADRWSEPIYSGQRYDHIEKGNCVLIGSAVYFKCLTTNFAMNRQEPAILKYDLLAREISPILIPRVGVLEHIKHDYVVLMASEDGGLGFAGMRNLSTLSLWSRMDHGSDEGARWVQSRVIELADMLPRTAWRNMAGAHVTAFADAGAGGGVIFIWSTDDLFSLHLKSGGCNKMLGKYYGPMDYVVAYFSFCTPALGAVSIDEGPGAGA